MKILASKLLADDEVVSRFLTEAKIANQIHHPNIVDIFDFLETENPRRVALIMDVLPGRPLDRVLEKGALPLDDVLAIGGQIASALIAAHKAGVIHRDLKPSNVHVCQQLPGHPPEIKLLDFGIAKLDTAFSQPGHRTATGTMLGTPMYMAPEQAAAEAVSPATDVYGLGELLFEMATGRAVYQGHVISVLHAKMKGELPELDLSSIGPAFDHLVRGCLVRDPALRPPMSQVEERMRAIDRAIDQGPTRPGMESGFDSGALHEVARIREARPSRARTVVALLGVSAALGGAVWLSGQSEPPATFAQPKLRGPNPLPEVAQPEPKPTSPELTASAPEDERAPSPGLVPFPGAPEDERAPSPGRVPVPEAPPPAPVRAAARRAVPPPAPEPATLNVEVRTTDGRVAHVPVFVDGELVGQSPVSVKVSAGAHEIEVKPTHVDGVRTTVRLEPTQNEVSRFEICNEDDTARLFVSSSPNDQFIRVEGQPVAKTPGMIQIPACRPVRVEVAYEDGRIAGESFKMKPGEKARHVFP